MPLSTHSTCALASEATPDDAVGANERAFNFGTLCLGLGLFGALGAAFLGWHTAAIVLPLSGLAGFFSCLLASRRIPRTA